MFSKLLEFLIEEDVSITIKVRPLKIHFKVSCFVKGFHHLHKCPNP